MSKAVCVTSLPEVVPQVDQTPSSIIELIEAHRAAVTADEAMFDGDGECLDDAGAEATQRAEQKAFLALALAHCRTTSDVTAKVAYFVNGTVGNRSSLIDYLAVYGEGNDDLFAGLLASLVAEEALAPTHL
ncbi:hypothetical protein J1C56_08920 [Aminobacter anthyllidis]|uniref:Uncharacterized protein n=1 Tax=Aminobacter anthyllidis TaxID=1035067 RepID=A0A9X1A9I1_9HYPH|nr:hypothetical protein [Aminobacter anthyllidis]MBT1155712.1 hypothetical protein [Aminobacter anthyllidis]